ncbi:hypothetical protein [Maritimibacter fusiformis]|uniref:Flagellar FliJ protein n=1 Tax=Maritimibacter fusiformis TaxID=2603819 RepID=A0A5D0R8R0_9RHOB|nr:hypothetical protein [Maritimibacter fusiformis]TYB77892.1 hypothetical protein FVF75_16775 [Maritimibacter fusiformis]
MTTELAGMAEVTQLILDAELARLRRISDEVAGLRAAIADLDRDVRARAGQLAEPQDADCARMAGRDGPWLDWVAARRRALMGALADAAARREAQRVVTRRAFGRVEAISGLEQLGEAEQKQRAQRRLFTDAR